MADISLVEALRECAPTIGDPSVDAVRLDAMTRLFEELGVLVRKSGLPVAEAEDAASAVFLRLVENGPRGSDDGPQTDDAARAYLRTCIRNQRFDALRRSQREPTSEPQDLESLSQAQSQPQDEIDWKKNVMRETGELTLQLDRARRRFFDEVVPFAAGQMRESARRDFQDALELRCVIAEGRTTIEQAIICTLGKLDQQTRATFDQRQARALRLLERSG